MRLVLDRRARRLLARLPRYDWYSVAELALLSLLALQCARLLLTIATPVGPLGDWRPEAGAAPPAVSILSGFDPFFRLADTAGAAAVVTGLDLKLFGIRADQASGRGAAIIGLPSGMQSSVSVGEEIMAGVTLKAVAFDHVTILRGGREEQVFLDQSQPATVVTPPPTSGGPLAGVNPLTVSPGAPVTAAALAGAATFSPRVGRNGVDGFSVQPNGDGSVLRATGLQPGDVIVSVNGSRVRDAADAQRIQQQFGRSGDATVIVERGGIEQSLGVRIVP
ncbi:type II secretion system protein N [Sphingomonas solaris]|uniref:Type II secretory pathway component PulC n=1 Tax=Alterirhizorhabdus solaris TaxID=2529389 RepID=A0A558R4B7_9SPHN|nr:type II secretion system protein N [Sphingomonas solaris]TVV74226.1 type II secretory pathway component PulC [Sphingomonas solaris]